MSPAMTLGVRPWKAVSRPAEPLNLKRLPEDLRGSLFKKRRKKMKINCQVNLSDRYCNISAKKRHQYVIFEKFRIGFCYPTEMKIFFKEAQGNSPLESPQVER
jgi:hypothetical protein